MISLHPGNMIIIDFFTLQSLNIFLIIVACNAKLIFLQANFFLNYPVIDIQHFLMPSKNNWKIQFWCFDVQCPASVDHRPVISASASSAAPVQWLSQSGVLTLSLQQFMCWVGVFLVSATIVSNFIWSQWQHKYFNWCLCQDWFKTTNSRGIYWSADDSLICWHSC